MNFEYNGNLSESDRINLVANEIVNAYPQVSIEKAKEAAMLEGRISEPKTAKIILNRLYNIMLVNSDSKNIVFPVYKDYMDTINNNIFREGIDAYIDLVDKINLYFQNVIEFPILGN